MRFSHSLIIKVFLCSFLTLCSILPKVQGDDDVESFLVENLSPLEDGVDKVELTGGKTPFIIGGETVTSGEFPWFTMLLQEIEGKLYFACGATLIAQQYVLTAAHCIKEDTVYGGVWVGALSNVSGSGNGGQYSELIRIEKFIKHPNYDADVFDNDFALIKLQLSSGVTPAKLDTASVSDSYKTGKELTAVGFGCTDSTQPKWELTLRKVELKYLDYDACTSFPTSLFPEASITDNMMCASDDDKSLCNGDSGSALYDEQNKIVVGVASWGRLTPFNPKLFPSIFARVSAQFDSWIKSTVCDEISDFDSGKTSLCTTSTTAPTPSPPTPYPTTEPPTAYPTSSDTESPTIKPSAYPTISPVANPKPTKPSPGGGTKTHKPTICEMEYQVALMTDEYGAETSWEIVSYQTGEVAASSSSKGSGSYPNSKSIVESGCLPSNCYIFTIKDSFGDGLCCEHGSGSYYLFVNDNLIAQGGSFKTREKSLFGTCRPVE